MRDISTTYIFQQVIPILSANIYAIHLRSYLTKSLARTNEIFTGNSSSDVLSNNATTSALKNMHSFLRNFSFNKNHVNKVNMI